MASVLLLCTLGGMVSSVGAVFNDGYMNVSNAKTPTQVRLAFNQDNGMLVSWNTFAQEKNPKVKYGLSKSRMNLTATSAVSVTYNTSLTYANHVNITELEPHTTYYYQPVGAHSNLAEPEPYSFTTARMAGDTTPFTIGVVVDMGTFGALGLSDHVGTGAANPLGVNEQTTIQAIQAQLDEFEFLVHSGDIAYADYWLKEEIQGYLPNTTIANGYKVYETILNAFYDELSVLSTVKPYMVSPGNHDSNCDNGGTTNKATGQKYTEAICSLGQTNFTGYMNHWRMPSGPSGGFNNFWYSYDYGMTHFVHIDTETDLGHGLVGPDEGSPEESGPFGLKNQQIKWLKADLAAVDRTKTPWVVVFGHRPLYLSAASSICKNCTEAFEPIFHQYDVDLYWSGHAHLYERIAPIYKGVVDEQELDNPRDTWYIVNGAAGHYDGLDTFDATIQNYSRYHQDTEYSWSTITFHNCSHMTVDSMYSANNSVYDSATLYKKRTC